ncbi:hypothetical protein D9M68_1009160 [compost metagenome]
MCALSTSSRATCLSSPGREIFSSTSMPKPVGRVPMPTAPSMEVSSLRLICSLPATNLMAPRKQAE